MSKAKLYIPRDAGALGLGSADVEQALIVALKKRGIDAEFVHTGSRGLYWLEPMIEVATPQGRVAYGPVAASEVEGLLDAGLLDGKPHKLCLGKPEELPFLQRQSRLTFARCGIVDRNSIDDYRALGGWAGLEKALSLGPAATVELVTKSGLRGRGGAGFPTGIKWKTVLDTRGDQKYIVCNADEGDSGTYADRMIMEGDPFTLIEGMAIAGVSVGATRGFIYIRSEYPHSIHVMQRSIDRARKAGILGDNIARVGQGVRFRNPRGRRCLCLRRRDLDARQYRRQTRPGASEAAATGA